MNPITTSIEDCVVGPREIEGFVAEDLYASCFDDEVTAGVTAHFILSNFASKSWTGLANPIAAGDLGLKTAYTFLKNVAPTIHKLSPPDALTELVENIAP